jgi:FtsZ-interacting cell division protein ZipA
MNQEACEATTGCIFIQTEHKDDNGNNDNDSFFQSAGFYIIVAVALVGIVGLGVSLWQHRRARTAAADSNNGQATGGTSRRAAAVAAPSSSSSNRKLRKNASSTNSNNNKSKKRSKKDTARHGQERPNMSSSEFATAVTARTFSTTGGIDDDGLAYEDV